MRDNYSPLMRNTLDGLSETAGCLYMKLLDVFRAHESAENERKAFIAACRYEEKWGGVLDYILRNMPGAPDDQTRGQLSAFFAERWRHNFLEATDARP